jgi:hypothetical protein
MPVPARKKSDYKGCLTQDLKLIDCFPAIGAITHIERKRKQSGESVADFYIKDVFKPKQLLSFGTADWLEPTDWKASLRADGLAARNVLFAYYHTGALALGAYILSEYLHF